MTKEEIKKWIERNQKTIESNKYLIEQAREQIEFGELIIKEIKKIKPDEK